MSESILEKALLEAEQLEETMKSNAKEILSSTMKEEINELVDALSKKKNEVHEAADVIYHLLVLLEANDIKIEDVLGELKKRQGVSGLIEKANRQ